MTYDQLLTQIEPKWQAEFRKFVETAEAAPEFLEYMKQHPECERAVEQAIRLEAESLGELSTLLSRSLQRSPEMLRQSMLTTLLGALELSKPVQIELMTKTLQEAARVGGQQAKERLRELFTETVSRSG